MKTRVLALIFGLGILGFAAAFIWAALRPSAQLQMSASGAGPTAAVSETLADGRIDVTVFDLGNREVRLEIRFTPDADAVETASSRPSVSVSMVGMRMDGLNPPLELIGPGAWRATLQLPMAGRWAASAGFGEDRAEVEFDAK